jgi:hypothetical protein
MAISTGSEIVKEIQEIPEKITVARTAKKNMDKNRNNLLA